MNDDTGTDQHVAPTPLTLDQQLCFPLYAATNLIQRLYRPLLEPLGLTYSQYLVMLVLWERSPVTVGDIRACLHLDIGTLSPLLKRMQTAGLITRRRDPQDERRVVVGLTPHGQDLHKDALSIPEKLVAQTGLERGAAEDLRSEIKDLVTSLAAAVS